jgi:predicted enzyme related to lactoylglutathione lyase
MIIGTHAIIYAEDADKARAFFRDVLDLPFVDVHGGWLIFKLPPAELGIHPAGSESPSGHHELYLMCDDLAKTVTELEALGAEFTGETQDAGFGLLATMLVPGAKSIGIYQPKHPTAYDL